jgi:SAM-dependent methyltransferase
MREPNLDPSVNPTGRFSGREGDYSKYRPSYPEALFADLDRLVWTPRSTVADIGAGTGLFTRLVAPRVGHVIAVEPNAAMAAQGRAQSSGLSNLSWEAGTAEATGLPEASVDVLTCAQAFHWFDQTATAREWRRILRNEGQAVLVWNERDEEAAPLHGEYNELVIRWCPDYLKVNHSNVTPGHIADFFAPFPVERRVYPYPQRFDLEGLQGRLRSASYCPALGQPGHRELMDGLAVLFDRYRQADGLVDFRYRTVAWIGRLT